MTLSARQHDVAIRVGGVTLSGATSYSVQVSMLTPSDAFALTFPFEADAWNTCRPDAVAQVLLDGVPIITGRVDDRELSEDGDEMTVRGRDKMGRLVQESVPPIQFGHLDYMELIAQIAHPWFDEVLGDNVVNRRLIRGRRGKIAGDGPVVLKRSKRFDRYIDPTQTRWAAILEILRSTREIAIATGAGALVVCQPTAQVQEAQFSFFQAKPGRRAGSNVLKMSITESVGDAYSRIDVAGTGYTAKKYGPPNVPGFGTAYDGPAPTGIGSRFQAEKRLLLVESVRNRQEAEDFARREMQRRLLDSLKIKVVAQHHGQMLVGARGPTLFACDALAAWRVEDTGQSGVGRIISCEYTSSRDLGETTTMELVPKEQELFQ